MRSFNFWLEINFTLGEGHRHHDGQTVVLRLLLQVYEEASTNCLSLYLLDLQQL